MATVTVCARQRRRSLVRLEAYRVGELGPTSADEIEKQVARLAGSRGEFDAAMTNLRRGTEQNRREAVTNAGRSVESAMKMLLDAHKVPRPKHENARPLWDELWKASVVAEKSDFAILAAPNLATTHGRHGVGQPVDVPQGVPELAVQSAAAAISYLANLFP